MTDAAEIFEAANSAAITEIVIGGRIYELGNLSPAGLADLAAWGIRIMDSQKPGGSPLNAADRDPLRILKALLRAGDPLINLKTVLSSARLQHVLIAGKEYMRQASKAALADTRGTA